MSGATPVGFGDRAREALADPTLREALLSIRRGWPRARARAIARLPEFDALRDRGRAIKDHVLAHLDLYLERFERAVTASGGCVHWARDAAEARRLVLEICKRAGARTVTKSKSMIAEEIDLNAWLEAHGIVPVETDLGEYIIQLAGQRPSHLVGPAVHMTREEITELFARHHGTPPSERAEELVAEARRVLRRRYLEADVGITGANFLIADTGSVITVTNEGNAELTHGLPRTQIVVASIEKIVPTMEEAFTLLRLLARSATGQEFSTYTTVVTGPRRAEDLDGPEAFHVVLLDNGRSGMIGGTLRSMLRCIRCGACLNHCPVYLAVGGHAYGSVYVGPMGAVLSPVLYGIEKARALPEASSFCGRCEEVCPVRIPLPALMRYWREEAWRRRLAPPAARWGMRLWRHLALRPGLYRVASGLVAGVLGLLAGRRGALRRLPLAGGWTGSRDLPAPEGATFTSLYRKGVR